MKYFMIYLSTYRQVILSCHSEEEAIAHVEATRQGEWPTCRLGYEVKIHDRLPTRSDFNKGLVQG